MQPAGPRSYPEARISFASNHRTMKGTPVTPIERSESKPSATTGLFATLRAHLPAKGTGAPSPAGRLLSASLLAILALFALTATPALALAPETPELNVKPIFASIAAFNGTLSPKALVTPEGTYKFLYKASPTECVGGLETTPGIALGLATPEVLPPEQVKSLTPATEYTVCLSITNLSSETAKSPPVTFKTAAAAPPEAPEATEATERKATTATLNGVVNPLKEGEPGHYRFLYRQSESEPGKCTGAGELETTEEPTPGTSPQPVSAAITPLEPGKPYTFCVKAINALGESTVSPPKTFETAIPPETPETKPATPIAATTATLHGVLNPGAPGNHGTYEFFYRQSATECELAGAPEKATPAKAAAGAKGEVATAEVTGLLPGMQYTFCLLAHNAAEEPSAPSTPITFTTPAVLPAIESEFVTELTASSATLGAQINPGGAETTYHFQYGTTESYGQSTPSSPSIGSDDSGHPAAAHIQGLQPSTVYHYRVLATNVLGTVEGPDQTFTTQGPGGTLALPDGRAWELVSPVQKSGAQVDPGLFALTQASEDGAAISYPLSAPFGANPAGNVREAQAISRRGPGGWSSEDIATPHTAPSKVNEVQGEYRFFSPDLSHGLVQPFGNTPLPPLQEGAEKTVYLRNNAGCAPTPSEAIPATCYLPLVTAANVPLGTKFGGPEEAAEQRVSFVTATPDLSHVVLSSHAPLTANGPEIGGKEGLIPQYYEWASGRLQWIPLARVGGNGHNLRRAVSNDGSRVVGSTRDPGHAYMTDMTNGEVLQLDKAQGVKEPSESEANFQIASSDGSLVFFSDTAQLTTSPGGGLYSYDVQTGRLTLLTVPLHGGDEFHGLVLGASEDGSYVYLVDGGVLSEAPNAEQARAVTGGDNLYVLHREVHGAAEAWTPSFIATLSPRVGDVERTGDEPDWEPSRAGELVLMGQQTVEVSPDGRYLAFMSDRSLTGYDNRDASSGEPDEEVYRYDAAGARLVCASCDPSGARPAGWRQPEGNGQVLSDRYGAWSGRWVAATIPGLTEGESSSQALYGPRYMLDSGRLFFDSHDALVPQDVNGVGDVYEYESGGVGGCPAANSGCVALLSGGAGPEESAFEDSSVSGSDVFFVTADRLAPQDVGNEYDMYDAHVCSAEAPCPVSVAPPPSCTTADACKAAISPQPGVFGAPASATFSGSGNVPPPASVPVKPKTAAQIRAEKLARALKACKKVKRKSKRLACGRQARKRYGPPHRAKKAVGKSTNGKGSK
jgi:hypothetical protein